MVLRTVSWILERCGDSLALVDGGESISICGVVQPLRNKGDGQGLPTVLGAMDEGRYLYLGLPQYPVVSGRHEIIWRERRFAVDSAHPIYVGGDISHWWGVLIPCDERA